VAKVERHKLARGIKLYPEHIWGENPQGADPTGLLGIQDELNDANVQKEQMQTPWAPFRMHFSVPFIDSTFIEGCLHRLRGATFPADSAIGETPFLIPFTLPPPQEFFETDLETDWTTPSIVLDEVTFYWDQRDEAAAIADQYWGEASVDPGPSPLVGGDGANGFKDERGSFGADYVDRLDFALAILEKKQTYDFDDATNLAQAIDPDNWKITNEVWSTEYGPGNYSGSARRFNPHSTTDIGIQLHPYRTYILALNCECLYDSATDSGENRLALPNLNINLKMRCRLMARDISTQNVGVQVQGGVQNIPTDHQGKVPAGTLALSAPAPGDDIEAEGSEGVSTNIEQVDSILRSRLGAGYTHWSSNHGVDQHVADDAAYSCIVVPMLANQYEGELNKTNIEWGVNIGASPYFPSVGDTRHIPLADPFVIHHVVACVNWQTRQFLQDKPIFGPTGGIAVVEMENHVGVAIGTGMRGDHYTYQQVAELQWTLAQDVDTRPHMRNLIDRVGFPMVITQGPVTGQLDFSWELMSIPLIQNPAKDGTGYSWDGTNPQGVPFFTGRSLGSGTNVVGPPMEVSGTYERANASTGAGEAIPNTQGAEQWLEVRWLVAPLVGIPDFNSVSGANAQFVGYGGNFVLIFGKRMLS
jgi:hypothetical protein